jgi:hypothetical protein
MVFYNHPYHPGLNCPFSLHAHFMQVSVISLSYQNKVEYKVTEFLAVNILFAHLVCNLR